MNRQRLLLAFVVLALNAARAGHLTVYDLRCNHQTNPPAVDDSSPRLSWKLESEENGQRQTAFQIAAASSEQEFARGHFDLWNTGKIDSPASLEIPYAGVPLRPDQPVWWGVRVWDAQGRLAPAFKRSQWTMGIMDGKTGAGVWIQRKKEPGHKVDFYADDPAPLFRKEFTVSKAVRRATVHVSGLGYYELHLNGTKVGDQFLDPGWTSYDKRVLYSTFDVTHLLHPGTNAAGMMAGNGWFNPIPLPMWGRVNLRDSLRTGEPRVWMRLRVEYEDGSIDTVATDPTWRTAPGPVLRNSVHLGEVYDARQEQPGWDRAGFDDAAWTAAVAATDAVGPLRAQEAPPIRETRRFRPLKITEPHPGVYIVDFGFNFSGWVRFRAQGPAGTRVILRHGELLRENGDLNGMTSVFGQVKGGGADYRYDGNGPPKTAFQQDEFILKGAGDAETFSPHFTFHGFRYVEVTGLPARPVESDFEGVGLNSDVAPVGNLFTRNVLVTRTQNMVRAAFLANFFSVESDCPHREKFGYGGDMVAASGAALFNFDMERFYAKAVQDLDDAARTNGGFTETAPDVGLSDEGLGGGAGPIGWGSAQPVLLWELHQFYGDTQLLADHYEATRRWIEFLKSRAPDGLLTNGISDHESLEPKPQALTATAFYYLNMEIFGRIARVLGKTDDAAMAEETAVKIKAAFNRRFLKSGGIYDTGTQCCQAFALEFGLVPDAEKSNALARLVENIEGARAGHLSTGIFGTRYMFDALTRAGRAEVAWEMASQKTFPGWGWMLENGATTLWEHWQKDDNTYSHDHPMFGSVSEWFYRGLAGINPADDASGFDRIVIRPNPVKGLDSVNADYESVRGKVVSSWTREGRHFVESVRIPPGAVAEIWLPSAERPQVLERGVVFDRVEDGRAVMRTASGAYQFECELPATLRE